MQFRDAVKPLLEVQVLLETAKEKLAQLVDSDTEEMLTEIQYSAEDLDGFLVSVADQIQWLTDPENGCEDAPPLPVDPPVQKPEKCPGCSGYHK